MKKLSYALAADISDKEFVDIMGDQIEALHTRLVELSKEGVNVWKTNTVTEKFRQELVLSVGLLMELADQGYNLKEERLRLEAEQGIDNGN